MNLNLVNQNGILLADSREVAEMTEVRHSDLLEKISTYSQHLLNGEYRSTDFFIESTYQDSLNRTHPRFLITKKGCDMVANKMTGEKGVLFTAAYVTKFEEMEQGYGLDVKRLSPEMQMFKHMFDAVAKNQIEQAETNRKFVLVENNINLIKETIIQREDNWRDSINKMFNTAVRNSNGQDFQTMRNESYSILEERGHCDLARRQRNKRERLQEDGATKTKVNAVTKMDVIEDDPKLKEIYTSIVKELSVRNMKMNA